MKNDFLKNSSQRVLFSAMMVSALVAGNVAPMHAEVTSVQSVLQSVSVKGQVLDAEGIPVIGASVLEKGTTNGVITDIDGNYSLNVSSKNAVVIIRKSKFPQNPKRSVRFSGKRTKRSVQKRKARNTQKAETKVL